MIEFLTPTHIDILNALNQAGVAVVIDNHEICKSQEFDGHFITKKDPKNNYNKSVLLICLKTIQKNYQDWKEELNRTIAHEAVHAAQACRSGDGYIRKLGFKQGIEEEAFAIQDNPNEVLRIVIKYCL